MTRGSGTRSGSSRARGLVLYPFLERRPGLDPSFLLCRVRAGGLLVEAQLLQFLPMRVVRICDWQVPFPPASFLLLFLN